MVPAGQQYGNARKDSAAVSYTHLVAFGAAMDLNIGYGALFTCCYGLCALVAGLFRDSGRGWFSVCALGGGCLLYTSSKSEPPLPPPIGRVVRLFLKHCSKPRNLITDALTEGCRPVSYTHLDVYKRQAQQAGDVPPPPSDDDAPPLPGDEDAPDWAREEDGTADNTPKMCIRDSCWTRLPD